MSTSVVFAVVVAAPFVVLAFRKIKKEWAADQLAVQKRLTDHYKRTAGDMFDLQKRYHYSHAEGTTTFRNGTWWHLVSTPEGETTPFIGFDLSKRGFSKKDVAAIHNIVNDGYCHGTIIWLPYFEEAIAA